MIVLEHIPGTPWPGLLLNSVYFIILNTCRLYLESSFLLSATEHRQNMYNKEEKVRILYDTDILHITILNITILHITN